MKMAVRILCAASCLLIGFSVLLPFFSVSVSGFTISRDLMEYDGIWILIIAAAALVLSAIEKYLPAAVLGMVSFGMLFVEESRITTGLGKEIDALARDMIPHGAGYYFLLAGSAALILFSVLGLASQRQK